MKIVTQVDITFENCDYTAIPAKYIRDMYMSDLGFEIIHDGLSILKKQYAKKIYLQFIIKSNITLVYGSLLFFDRVREWNDIASIKVYYDDKTSEVYFVDWDENGLGENKNQMSQIVSSDLGNDLCIGICENVEPFFNEMAGIE